MRVEARTRSPPYWLSLRRAQRFSGTSVLAGSCSDSGTPGSTDSNTGSSATTITGINQGQLGGPRTSGTTSTSEPQPLRDSVSTKASTTDTARSTTTQRRQRLSPCWTRAASVSGQTRANQAEAMLA